MYKYLGPYIVVLMSVHLRRRLLKWGNGYGVRITKKEAMRLGLKPGSELDLEIRPITVKEEVDALPAYRLGGQYDIDATLEEELDAGH